MTAPHRGRYARRYSTAGWACALLIVGTVHAQVAPEPPPELPPPTETKVSAGFALPPYLRGIDLDLPTQAAFKNWPPPELEERAYWLPWSSLALQRAQLVNQPIFLMVTVPWNRYAQRMLKEALADAGVLRAMNRDYVAVAARADRRPDVYARYGTGNWPSLSLLLPDGSPMLSQVNPKGIALPITLGFADVDNVLFTLTEGRKYFEKWQNVLQGVSQIYEQRVDLEEVKPGPVDAKAVEPVVRWLLGNADGVNGGFGAAPKFVLRGLMEIALLRENRQQPALVEPARKTLVRFSSGPLHDVRDGGFHRMAAAPEWGSIQYEKMLEANANMVRELVFALRDKDEPALREALADTSRFLTTVLARPDGGFYNAQIADPTSPDGGAYWLAADRASVKPPAVDKLVLAGPNALAGAALLRAGAILGDPTLASSGVGAVNLVLDRAVQAARGADHVIEPEPERGRYLVTQSEVAFGLLDAYESTGDRRYLDAAKDIAEFVENNMRVGGETAYRDHAAVGREFGLLDMPLRPLLDNTRMARVLVRLQAHGVLDGGRARAEALLASYAGDLALKGASAIEPSLAIEEFLTEPLVVTIGGAPADPVARSLRRAALNLRHGWMVIRSAPGDAPSATLAWRGSTRKISDPAALASGLDALRAAAAGAS